MPDTLINIDLLKSVDKSDMFGTLRDFPKQAQHAVNIGKQAPSMPAEIKDKIFILGMGGSAIGGDLLASYFASSRELAHFSIITNRDYKIPGTLNSDSAVIASSYSGGTEETLDGIQSAYKRTQNISCITTGGKLGDISDQLGLPKILVPEGFMPRCALAYSFFPMLSIVIKSITLNPVLYSQIESDIESVLTMLEAKSEIYSSLEATNPAIQIANKLHGRIPVIYSSNSMSSVNLRLRCQIQENAKHLCWGHVLPEMNHNEINSWTNPKGMPQNFAIITIEDVSDNSKVKARFEAVRELLNAEVSEVISISDDGSNFLNRMFGLIYLGDWVSYYLAILNGEDPTPIPLISKLKEILAGKP